MIIRAGVIIKDEESLHCELCYDNLPYSRLVTG